MLDNKELNEVLEKLENLEDEELAVKLLKEFNEASSHLGKLLRNLDESLAHDEWKAMCDRAQARLDSVINKINAL